MHLTTAAGRLLPHACAVAVAVALLTGCATDDASTKAPAGAVSAAQERAAGIQRALDDWAGASDLTQAQRAAETVSNLVTGPHVAWYGDADGDGAVGGEVSEGLLPGEAGEPGLGLPLEGCAGPDLLGGSWSDPGARWDELATKIAAWTPTNNPFPTLASHAQRTVGWAQLTLRAADLAEALEYSGHAQLHVDALTDAIDDCA